MTALGVFPCDIEVLLSQKQLNFHTPKSSPARILRKIRSDSTKYKTISILNDPLFLKDCNEPDKLNTQKLFQIGRNLQDFSGEN